MNHLPLWIVSPPAKLQKVNAATQSYLAYNSIVFTTLISLSMSLKHASTWEVEERGSRNQSQPQLHSKFEDSVGYMRVCLRTKPNQTTVKTSGYGKLETLWYIYVPTYTNGRKHLYTDAKISWFMNTYQHNY